MRLIDADKLKEHLRLICPNGSEVLGFGQVLVVIEDMYIQDGDDLEEIK